MKKIEVDRNKLTKQAIKNVEELLKNDCKFLTNEGERGIVTLMLKYHQEPRCEYERVLHTNYTEDGPTVTSMSNKLDNSRFRQSMESIEYLIRHFIFGSSTAVGDLQFTFVNGYMQSCTIKGKVTFMDIKNKN
ncbi:hypothetical protein V1503_24085 [Bacillus sp. SCS-151]|uniref:hypothetical protein n=1 Tax=Nanhaiella sioensis TaxID=3115293 RepID=UPI0039782C9A